MHWNSTTPNSLVSREYWASVWFHTQLWFYCDIVTLWRKNSKGHICTRTLQHTTFIGKSGGDGCHHFHCTQRGKSAPLPSLFLILFKLFILELQMLADSHNVPFLAVLLRCIRAFWYQWCRLPLCPLCFQKPSAFVPQQCDNNERSQGLYGDGIGNLLKWKERNKRNKTSPFPSGFLPV